MLQGAQLTTDIDWHKAILALYVQVTEVLTS